MALSEAILPARRTLKTSPNAWSNNNSTGARESLQLNTDTKGCCSFFVKSISDLKSLSVSTSFVKRSLPNIRISSASCGVILSRSNNGCLYILMNSC